MHQVKIFTDRPEDGGILIGIIPPEELTYISDETSKARKYKPKPSRLINCEFCGDPAKVQLESMTTCKKTACVEKKIRRRQVGREKMLRKRINPYLGS